LNPDKTKTGEGRTVPIFDGDMRDFLLAAKKERDEQRPDSPWDFNREERQIIDFRILWANACKKPECLILNSMTFVEQQFATCDEQGYRK
jgi:hypothetical protein